MRSNRGRVMVGTPTLSGDLWADYSHSLINSMVLAAQHGWEVQTNVMSGNSLIPYARAIIGQDFIESECDCLFFIDSDLSWDPEAFVRMISAPFDMMGGAYPLKQDGDPKFHIKINGTLPKPNGKPIMVETTGVGGGFLKVTRFALEKMRKEYPDLKAEYRGREIYMLWDCLIIDGVPIGEDFSFCKRWINLGGKIQVDPNIDFAHYGHKKWEGNFLKDVINKEMNNG